MMDKALLAKIRKCLALGASANEHEAAAAIAKARALMDEHGITEDDVTLAEVEEASVRGTCTQKPPLWETYLCAAVRHALGVDVFINVDLRRTYIGRGPSAEIATYAFAVLFRKLKAARADYIRVHLKRCKIARKRQRADVFCQAWAAAVHRKVAALMPARERDPLLDTYLVERHPGLVSIGVRQASSKGRSTSDDYWNGRAAGGRVDLSIGVGGAQSPLAIT